MTFYTEGSFFESNLSKSYKFWKGISQRKDKFISALIFQNKTLLTVAKISHSAQTKVVATVQLLRYCF
jgi:hypothetical protein